MFANSKSNLFSGMDSEYLDSVDDAESYKPLASEEPLNEDNTSEAGSLNESPSLFDQARAICEGCDKRRLLVEALVLARVSPEGISAATGLNPRAITAFESHFFNFRPALKAPDFITFKAIWPCDYVKTIPQIHGVLLKRIAYARGPLFLEAVAPYLLHGKPLFESLDASTPEGRTKLLVELALASELLPEHGRRQHSPVLSVNSFMREMDQRQSSRAISMRNLADSASLLLEEWSKDLVWEPPQQPAKESAPQEQPKTQQVAQAG